MSSDTVSSTPPNHPGRHIQVSPTAITIDGINQPLDDVIHAEASIVEDWRRIAVIMLVALIGPILVMVIMTLSDGSRNLGMAFGPTAFVFSVILGLIGCAIGVAWKKPWGVIVERREFGHSCLLRCDNSDQAESLATEIRNAIAQRDQG